VISNADARDGYQRRQGQRANDHLRRQHEEEAMPDPSTPPYSEATRADVEKKIRMLCGDGKVADGAEVAARVVLRGLARRGLLLSEGAETRTERHYSPAHDGLVQRQVITTPWVPAPPDPGVAPNLLPASPTSGSKPALPEPAEG
jgi:hypothetical protein